MRKTYKKLALLLHKRMMAGVRRFARQTVSVVNKLSFGGWVCKYVASRDSSRCKWEWEEELPRKRKHYDVVRNL